MDSSEKGKYVLIIPEADIVADKVAELKDEIMKYIDEGKSEIHLDLKHVDLIDSSGIGVLILARNSLNKMGGSLKLANVNEDILKMFRIMRLDRHFDIIE